MTHNYMTYLYVDYKNKVTIISRTTALKRLNRDAVICNMLDDDTIIISDSASYYANNPDLSPLCN